MAKMILAQTLVSAVERMLKGGEHTAVLTDGRCVWLGVETPEGIKRLEGSGREYVVIPGQKKHGLLAYAVAYKEGLVASAYADAATQGFGSYIMTAPPDWFRPPTRVLVTSVLVDGELFLVSRTE